MMDRAILEPAHRWRQVLIGSGYARSILKVHYG